MKKLKHIVAISAVAMIAVVFIPLLQGGADAAARGAFLANGCAKSTTNVIKWSSVEGAEGYDVYFAKCGKSYRKVKTTAGLKYTKKSLSKTGIYKH